MERTVITEKNVSFAHFFIKAFQKKKIDFWLDKTFKGAFIFSPLFEKSAGTLSQNKQNISRNSRKIAIWPILIDFFNIPKKNLKNAFGGQESLL